MKKYIEVYNYYRNLIESGELAEGNKMPSIRKSVNLLNVSKTTVLNAYFALQADGYIIASEKSGHYVAGIQKQIKYDKIEISKKSTIKYDLKSGSADKDAFDINLWQRYIKNALRQKERLLTYSEVQGEQDLRDALVSYIREKRNVITTSDKIVIGAGVQCLLNILCSLIKDKSTVSFPDKSFYQGMSQFKDYGFEVHTRDKNANIIYVCPSHMTSYGDVMPIKRRLELVEYSQKNNSLVIEDDYDNDFMYQTKPTPSLYALSNSNNVIYMGSFSNVLIPGIRISFMVLNDTLANEFNINREKFAQTASKTEQIALCGYIRDGHIMAQTRKVRRHYTSKAKILLDLLESEIPSSKCSLSENSLQVKFENKFNKDISIFDQNGISVHINKYDNNKISLVLSPSAVEEQDLSKVAGILKSIFTDS